MFEKERDSRDYKPHSGRRVHEKFQTVRMPSALIKPRYIALDSSHFGQWARDSASNKAIERAEAVRFEEWLQGQGYVPLMCHHHLEELANHENEAIVLNRLRFIRNLKFFAWIAQMDGSIGMGSIVTLLAEEARAAMEFPSSNAVEIRDRAASQLIKVGTGEDVIGPDPDAWLELQPIFRASSEKAREVMAVGRSKVIDISDMKMADLMNGRLRKGENLRRQIEIVRGSFAFDIAQRGDPRIRSPSAMAGIFIDQVEELSKSGPQSASELVLYGLTRQGVSASDIKPESTVGDMLTLGVFRSQLRVVADKIGFKFEDMAAAITVDQIPSWIISEALRRHGQDLPRRQGSELNDGHLACLAAYADITFVDKRTLENFRRASSKAPLFAQLVKRVERSPSYREIPDILGRIGKAFPT